MFKIYKNISKVLLGILLLTAINNFVSAQCDPRFSGATYTGTSVVGGIATILQGETAQLKFNFGVGPQSGCNAAAGNVAGRITVTLTFNSNYAPTSAASISGTQASLYNWTWDPVALTLTGVNNALIPPGPTPQFTVNVIGNVVTAGTGAPLTTLRFTNGTPPITNGNGGNDQASAGLNVDPAVNPIANNDAASTTPNTAVTIATLANDTPAAAALDPASVLLIDPADGVKKTSVTIVGEGTYTIDTATGNVIFTPEAGAQNLTSTIQYTVKDVNGVESNQATITVTLGALPVTLVSFTAQKEGETAVLNWATTQEANSDRFEIEQSLHGKVWNRIGKVESTGESKVLIKYSFTDVNPVAGSENLYRLKMVDKDETFAFSRIQSVKFDGVPADLSVYPNPVSDKLVIRDFAQVSQVNIYDLKGLGVYQSGLLRSDEISVSNLPTGVYTVRITRSNGSQTSQKIVVKK